MAEIVHTGIEHEKKFFDARFSYIKEYFKIIPVPRWDTPKVVRYNNEDFDVFVLCCNTDAKKIFENDLVLIISKRADKFFSYIKMLPKNEYKTDLLRATYDKGKVLLETGYTEPDGTVNIQNSAYLTKGLTTRSFEDCSEVITTVIQTITHYYYIEERGAFSFTQTFVREDRIIVCNDGMDGVPVPPVNIGTIPPYNPTGGGVPYDGNGSSEGYGSYYVYYSGGGYSKGGSSYDGNSDGDGSSYYIVYDGRVYYLRRGSGELDHPAVPDGGIDLMPECEPDEPEYGYEPEDIFGDEEVEEIIIDSSFKGTKAECVYDKLMNLSGGFKAAIQKFDGEFPVSHLHFSVSYDLLANTNGITYPPYNFITEIALNGSNLDRPNLDIARTIVHETIHAEIHRKLLSAAQKEELNYDGWTKAEVEQYVKNIQNDFPGIFDFYTRYLDIEGKKDEWQHEQMAAYYREWMVDILKEIDPMQTDEIYEALAWVGLKGTTA